MPESCGEEGVFTGPVFDASEEHPAEAMSPERTTSGTYRFFKRRTLVGGEE